MFENLDKAAALNRPACQDTGVIQFFLKAGAGFPLLSEVRAILTEAVLTATKTAPLRHNAVQIFQEKNTGNNTGERIPWIDWEIVPDDRSLTVEVYMAGGGCSLPGQGRTLMPAAGYEGVVQFVFDVMTWQRGQRLPADPGRDRHRRVDRSRRQPFQEGLVPPIGSVNPNARGAQMESLIEKGLNDIGLGPQGLSGRSSVMGVHIKSAARHPSTISVAISTGCWAHRRGTIRIAEDLSYEILSHKGAIL